MLAHRQQLHNPCILYSSILRALRSVHLLPRSSSLVWNYWLEQSITLLSQCWIIVFRTSQNKTRLIRGTQVLCFSEVFSVMFKLRFGPLPSVIGSISTGLQMYLYVKKSFPPRISLYTQCIHLHLWHIHVIIWNTLTGWRTWKMSDSPTYFIEILNSLCQSNG